MGGSRPANQGCRTGGEVPPSRRGCDATPASGSPQDGYVLMFGRPARSTSGGARLGRWPVLSTLEPAAHPAFSLGVVGRSVGRFRGGGNRVHPCALPMFGPDLAACCSLFRRRHRPVARRGFPRPQPSPPHPRQLRLLRGDDQSSDAGHGTVCRTDHTPRRPRPPPPPRRPRPLRLLRPHRRRAPRRAHPLLRPRRTNRSTVAPTWCGCATWSSGSMT